MVLQLLLLIFLAALITTENNTTHSVHAIKIDYFDSFQSIDPIPLPTFALNQDSEITTTLIKTTTVTTATDSSNVEQDEEEENAEMEDEDDGEEDDIAATTTISFPDTSIQTAIYQTSSSSKHVPITNSTTNSTIQYTNTSDPLVQYDLDCQADDTFCSKINRVVGAAIDEFSRVVNVKNSLIIKVYYYSFCNNKCANDTLGWGAPTSQFTLPFEDGADLNYVYPQALAKQLAPYSSTSVWSTYDVEIAINHDAYMNSTDLEQAVKQGWNGTGTPLNGKYWLFNESTQSIQPHQIDFRYIVLHELMHGLGFLSSWAPYFWSEVSPFRYLLEGVIDPLELQLVTPGPYWYVNQETGPTYVTGFQPTMIFDKFLVNLDTELNVTMVTALSDLAFQMQDFCVQNNDAFIVNFIRAFNAANQSNYARKLWMSLSERDSLIFQFQPAAVANSSYNLIPYLNHTYTNMSLLTGENLFTSRFEQTDTTLNRPGLMISHLDDSYIATPDFLMTQGYHTGQTLEDLVKKYYATIPTLRYNATTTNNSIVEMEYKSPIGPGILRILDSIGYSTVLTRTNYTTDGSVKTPKSRSMCDDSNTNHGLKPSSTPSSLGVRHDPHLYGLGCFVLFIYYLI